MDGLVGHVYAYSFIATNLDVSTPARAVAVEAWHRMRTDIEDRIRDAKHGAALRHLPSASRAANTVWMWGALLAVNLSAWLGPRDAPRSAASADRGFWSWPGARHW